MPITTIDGIVAGLSTAQTLLINKASIATQGAGGWSSLWRATGTPTQAAIPGAFARCTNALSGSIVYDSVVDPKYLAWLSLAAGNAGQAIELHDRLAHMGGLSGATTGPQTVGVDVTGTTNNMNNRIGNADMSQVRWWAEIYTSIGTSAQTCTVTYTRHPGGAGNTGQTVTFSLGGASPLNQAGRIFPLIPNGTDRIQSIESVSIPTTTGTGGSWGITATRHLSTLTTNVANKLETADWALLGFPRIHDEACLALLMFAITTSTGTVVGSGKMVAG